MDPGDLHVSVYGRGGNDMTSLEMLQFSTAGGRLRLIHDQWIEDYRFVSSARLLKKRLSPNKL